MLRKSNLRAEAGSELGKPQIGPAGRPILMFSRIESARPISGPEAPLRNIGYLEKFTLDAPKVDSTPGPHMMLDKRAG